MPAKVIDFRWDSGNGTKSVENEELDLVYIVAYAIDQDDAVAAVEAVAPTALARPSGRTIVQQSMEWEIADGDLVSVTVHYGPAKPLEPGGYSFAFDTTGGTKKITQSKSTVQKYAPSGKTAPDYKGSIGVTDDGVDGVEVQDYSFKWTETHLIPLSQATFAYALTLAALSGKRNAGGFRGFAADAVIFRGAQGGKKDEENAEINFSFEAGNHATNLDVGNGLITGIAKKAWQYLWVRYQEVEDATAKATVKRPQAVYIEEVVDAGNFSQLGIGS